MLQNVAIPVAAIGNMKPAHLVALAGLLSFADADGRCWPSLRTFADIVGKTLSWAQRNLAEMVELNYLKRRARGRRRSPVYTIDSRFLSKWQPKRRSEAESQKRDSEAPASAPPISPAIDRGEAESPIFVRTERIPRKESHQGRAGARARFTTNQESGGLPDRDDPVLWRARLRSWAATAGRVWPVDAGPRPDQPGCWAPQSLLTAMAGFGGGKP